MTDLIDTTEMYLRTIFELIEDGVPPLRARIAEQLGHSGPTVSQTVARMERDGLLVVEPDRTLRLTARGLQDATRVMRKHRLAERLLTDVIGLDLPFVHEEACRWEHVMSDRVERRVLEMLGTPAQSPYGNPIPGLDELGVTVDPAQVGGVWSADQAVREGVTDATVIRIGEHPQTLPGFLQDVLDIGLLPGAMVALAAADDGVTMTTERGELTLPGDVARHLFVGKPVQGSVPQVD